MRVRPEEAGDVEAIRDVNIAAFRNHPYSEQTEHLIVAALRASGALSVSLVAVVDGRVVGHIAFSKAGIGDVTSGWYLLGPIAVLPENQRQGVGRALIERGLGELRELGADGCALVGDPAFYQRFGFRQVEGVSCDGVPDENVLCLTFSSAVPRGVLHHHAAFSVQA